MGKRDRGEGARIYKGSLCILYVLPKLNLVVRVWLLLQATVRDTECDCAVEWDGDVMLS